MILIASESPFSSHIIIYVYLAAERTTEESAMNETSSRSHQILRLVFTLLQNYLVIEINISHFIPEVSKNSEFMIGFLQTVESNPSDFVGTAKSGAVFASVVSSLPLLEGGYWGWLCLCIFKLPGI
jgi:hypothetical protein